MRTAGGETGEAPAIVADGVGRSFGSTVALAGIGLALDAGAVHALVGENGAGKSTFLGAIAGRVRVDAGGSRRSAAAAATATRGRRAPRGSARSTRS